MALLQVFAGGGGHEKRGWYEGPIWWERGSSGFSPVLKSTKSLQTLLNRCWWQSRMQTEPSDLMKGFVWAFGIQQKIEWGFGSPKLQVARPKPHSKHRPAREIPPF